VHFSWSNPAPALATTLISGSYAFLKRSALDHRSGRTLLVLDEPWHGKTPRALNEVSWRRLKPTQFGSSTQYPVIMGSSGFTLAPQFSTLARNIGHILDHGIRPTFLSASVAESFDSRQQDFYVSNSLLDPRYLERPVAYQTSYSSSRWGSRVLTSEELSSAFGLPARLSLGGLEKDIFPIVPLQVLSGCLNSLGGITSWVLQPLNTPSQRGLAPILLATWLPTTGKRLTLGLTSLPSLPKPPRMIIHGSPPTCGTSVSFFHFPT
jgi:hypothetical protein